MRYGLIGWPLGHSISPQLHRRLAGVEYELRPLPEAEFERFMRERDFSAVNVTIPYKRQVLPYCAQLTPAARRCGSVNLLIKSRDGTLTGDNTDLAGLEFLLRQNGWVLTGQTVVILGSGGTGHTAKAAAEELGAAEIATVSRTGELNYENLAKRFGKRDFYLINTTPVGMAPQSGVSPLDLRQFPRCKGVADVIYNPLRTRLCQQAAELGIPACGGLLMLAAQAAAAEYAFGTAVPGEETVLRVYRELLAERRNLVFIGMPGSGKTTIGRLAAQMLEREFIDCDEEYLLEYGITPQGELLARGELYFREREEALLRKLSPKTGCVIAAGGGAILREENVESLFDVDTVMNITHKVSQLTGAHYGETEKRDVSLRVITDHIRSATFMICDGILPSNEGRGYVLRRLLRRAARHGKLLGVNEPFLYQVVDTVIHENQGQYPDLREKQTYITKVIRTEEENFGRTIDGGMKIFSDLLAEHQAKGEKVFSGADAFRLYDTFGFPIDLTAEMVAEQGMTVDEESFRQLMQEQKQRAREARKALGDLGWAGVEFGKDIPATEFVGYDHDELDATVVALVAEDELRGEIPAGSDAVVVLDKSPFYAEMGGQVADHGTISAPGMLFTVTDVQKNKGGKFMHYGQLTEGALHVGDTVHAAIDTQRRKAIRRAHSTTHLLDAALKKVLGDHVHQAGSLVEPDRLRFDFTHFEAITPDQLHQVEELVNDAILEGYPVVTEVLPIEEAKKKGAVAMFGEKYGDTVRVVEMGDVSIEFCGGTHVDNTAKAGPFRVKSETSVASGVRRIEATCGKLSLQGMERSQGVLHKAAQFLKTAPAGLLDRMEQQANEMKQLRQALDKLKAEASLGEAKQFLASAKTVRGLHVITTTRTGMDVAAMRTMGDFLRDKDPGVVAVIASINGEKVSFLAVCGKEAVARGIKAGDLVRSVSAVCGGKGGGKPDSAMGGGTELLKVDDALAAVDDFVSEKIS